MMATDAPEVLTFSSLSFFGGAGAFSTFLPHREYLALNQIALSPTSVLAHIYLVKMEN